MKALRVAAIAGGLALVLPACGAREDAPSAGRPATTPALSAEAPTTAAPATTDAPTTQAPPSEAPPTAEPTTAAPTTPAPPPVLTANRIIDGDTFLDPTA